MQTVAYSPDPSPLDQLIDDLHELEIRVNATSWDKAERYVVGYAKLQPEYPGLTRQRLTRAINKDIRSRAIERGLRVPRPTFLANARTLADTWPKIFSFKTKDCDYEHYRQIAVCSLPRAQKDQLREWLETFQPTQEVLRQRIREAVDAYNGIHKPDFELKVSNFWKFSTPYDNDHFGGIHPGVMANLLFWFTEPGDIVIDPMAGTGLLAETLWLHRFYRETYEAEGSGPRTPLMSDIAPRREDILCADARNGLPFDAGIAQLAVIDPPYLTIADGKQYENLGKDIESWLTALGQVVESTLRCIKPGGVIAVITDDLLRIAVHQPVGYRVTKLLADLGLIPRATIYNHTPNFLYTMGPAMMKAARLARLHVNSCKVIQVASRRI